MVPLLESTRLSGEYDCGLDVQYWKLLHAFFKTIAQCITKLTGTKLLLWHHFEYMKH